MDPDYPELICDYEACEIKCPYREAQEKLEAVRNYIVKLRGVEEKIRMTGSSKIANYLEKILKAKNNA